MINDPSLRSVLKNAEPRLQSPGSAFFFVPKQPAPKIALVASIAWTLWNYRLALIHALQKAGYEVILIAADDHSRLELERCTNATFFPLQHLHRSSISPFTHLVSLLELYTTLRRAKPDLVLCFTIRPNTLGNFAAKALNIPSISTIEGVGISGSSQWWLRKVMQSMYQLAFRTTRKVLFLNKQDQDEFVQKGIVPIAKTMVVPGPGIDLDHFTPLKKNKISQYPVFLFMARLLAEKGIREFAEAARMLQIEGEKAVFRVLGTTDSGNPTSIHASELDSWVNQGIFEYIGFVDDVRPFIADADVLVLPSYYREGVPRAVLEGMAMGKMIITTDSVGCRDTVENGKNGFLTPPRDAKALAETIKMVLKLPTRQIRQMGENSRKKAEQEFADELVIPRYLLLIHDLLTGINANIGSK